MSAAGDGVRAAELTRDGETAWADGVGLRVLDMLVGEQLPRLC